MPGSTATKRQRRRKINQKRGRLRCHKRPKSREETPQGAYAARGLPRCNNMHVRCTKARGTPRFFGKRERTLGPCFYLIFKDNRSPLKNIPVQQATHGRPIGGLRNFNRRLVRKFGKARIGLSAAII